MRISRRSVLAGVTAVAGCQALPQSPQSAASLNLDQPDENLRHIMRVLGDAAGGDVLYWFSGFIYAMTPDKKPFPLVHFNGVNAMRFMQNTDGSYSSRHHSISFMEDVETHALLEEFENPITGAINRPEPNVFNGSIYDYAAQGTKMRKGEWSSAAPFHEGMWTFGAGSAWMTIDRPFAARFGHPWGEARTYEVDLSDLYNPALTSLPCRQHSMVSNPLPKWMKMEDADGYALWQANGKKLRNTSQLPPEILERCQTYMPVLFDYDVVA